MVNSLEMVPYLAEKYPKQAELRNPSSDWHVSVLFHAQPTLLWLFSDLISKKVSGHRDNLCGGNICCGKQKEGMPGANTIILSWYFVCELSRLLSTEQMMVIQSNECWALRLSGSDLTWRTKQVIPSSVGFFLVLSQKYGYKSTHKFQPTIHW